MPSARTERALEMGEAALAGCGVRFVTHHPPRQWVAIGDPQAPAARFFEVLDERGLLANDGTLLPNIGLVSMGDHFDYGGPEGKDVVAVERAGRVVLSWLAAHDPHQVHILFGNHDAARVMELAFETDETFAAARAFVHAATTRDEATKAEFRRRHPHIPTPGIAGRDYSSFSVAQRSLVQRLLLDGRFTLAHVRRYGEDDVLFTHAGITQRELAFLDVTAEAKEIARALEARFASAIAAVRAAWEKGEHAALDLAPIHVPGRSGAEGGGLLYHRPKDRGLSEKAWDFEPTSPRRFSPDELPRGLVQACGHSSHERCLRELGTWATDAAKAAPHASLRTLSASSSGTIYDVGLQPPRPDASTLYMIDPALAHAPVSDVELLFF